MLLSASVILRLLGTKPQTKNSPGGNIGPANSEACDQLESEQILASPPVQPETKVTNAGQVHNLENISAMVCLALVAMGPECQKV